MNIETMPKSSRQSMWKYEYRFGVSRIWSRKW